VGIDVPRDPGATMYKTPVALLRFVGKAALNAAGGGVLGDFCIEVLPEFFVDIWASWSREKDEQGRRAELEALASAAAGEVREAVSAVVDEIAADRPEGERQVLATILTQVPARIRQTLRRPTDPTGTTVPAGLILRKAEDLLPFLPDRMPRFKPGDRPIPGVDWELVELLGIGGFGEVWKARHTHLDDFAPVALKFCIDPKARERLLLHEAKVCARVKRQGHHPGIVQLQETYLSADPPCLQYEFIEGGDLAGLIQEWHRQPAKPTSAQVETVMLRLCEIVAFAHRVDPPIVHRDLKPVNILVRRTGGAVEFLIADFGIGGIATARAIEASRRRTTPSQFMTVAVRGSFTALYASPEQKRGGPPDPRDDVHALGVIWYQMMTGDLSSERPGDWKEELAEQGMAPEMVNALSSCFNRAGRRPADAVILGEMLGALHVPTPPPVPPPGPKPSNPKDVPVAPVMSATPHSPRGPVAGTIITNTIGMTLTLIPAGEFLMGAPDQEESAGADEKPQRRVKLTRPFYVGVHQVTQAEYEAVMGVNPSFFSPLGDGKDRVAGMDTARFPVENVSWLDAVAFCNRLSEREHLRPYYRIQGQGVTILDGGGYRLPTEAEWEYACRAGTTTPFHFGAKVEPEQANFDANFSYGDSAKGASLQRPTPVGSYPANDFGLRDIHGNVWEWCWDWHAADYYKKSFRVDPDGPDSGTSRVLRGGSWRNSPWNLRSAIRRMNDQSNRFRLNGFRLASTYNWEGKRGHSGMALS